MKTTYKKEFFFSVIIPFSQKNNFLIENINSLKKQKYHKFEVILVGNEDEINMMNYLDEKIIYKYVNYKSPSKKRNLGNSISKGEFLAFIDDDAYPDVNWLYNINNYLNENKSALVLAGPSLTPKDDGFFASLSSDFYESYIGGGNVSRYRKIKNLNFVKDWPSVNFVINKELFNSIKGFNSNIWPGEDTLLCENLEKKNIKIHYLCDSIVFHHRRNSLIKHIRQVYNYGYIRGNLIRNKLIRITFKALIPTFFILYMLSLLAIYLIFKKMNLILLIPFIIYMVLIFFEQLRISKKSIINSLIFPLTVIISHFFYGFAFINGLSKKRNKIMKRF